MQCVRCVALLLALCAASAAAQCTLGDVLAGGVAYKSTDARYSGRFDLLTDDVTIVEVQKFAGSSCTVNIFSELTVLTDNAFNATVTSCDPSAACASTVCPQEGARESYTFVFNGNCDAGTITSDALDLTFIWTSGAGRASLPSVLVVVCAALLGALAVCV